MAYFKLQLLGLITLLMLIAPLFETHAQLTPKLIVTTKKVPDTQDSLILSSVKARASRQQKSIRQKEWKKISDRTYRVEVAKEEIQDVMEELKADFEVESVEVDLVMNTYSSPNDQHYQSQWSLTDSFSGINMPSAWEITQGSAQQIIAIVDTGILAHPDFATKILPGFDLISDTSISNDGNGRDNDPTDPGDWVAAGDPCYRSFFQSSSWHGTHVAGIAAATGNNGTGIAGVSWHARILPVRVLGKCGGYSSDIADGIRWAAGGSVSGTSANSNPAKVINLSLGGRGSCGSYMQSAIDFAISRGSVVVVAAGNENLDLDYSEVSPANCQGVITVGATQSDGARAGYSNYGRRIDVMAPGGGQNGSILSTYNSGQTTPSGYSYLGLNGTSMAAPHVAGVASLILSINPGLYPAQVKDIIKRSARSLSDSWSCPMGACGEGLADAYEALRLAQVTTPDGRFQGDEPVRDGGGNSGGSEVEVGGGCGTIDTNPKGPSNGGPMILTMLFIMAMISRFKNKILPQ